MTELTAPKSSVTAAQFADEIRNELKYTQGVIIRFDTHPSILEVEGCFTGYGFNGYRFMDYELEKDQFYEAI